MATQPQTLANRRNAQKSTGPKTPQGKALVSKNALKHGLSTSQPVITSESQADFDLHRDSLLADLAPAGPMESILADRIVGLSWRLERAARIQNQTIDAMTENHTSDPFANLAKSFPYKRLGAPQPPTPDSNADLTLGRIAIKDFSNSRVLDRLLMYERRLENSMYKTILELQRLQLIRHLDPQTPTQAPTPTDQRATSHKPRPTPPTPMPVANPHRPAIIHQPSARTPKNHDLFTQNKPNSNPILFMDKTNATLFAAKVYDNKPRRAPQKNEPKTNPIQTQTNPISEKPKMNLNFYSTKDYDNKPRLAAPGKQTQNKPNSNPNKPNFTYPQRGKTEVRCRMSEVRYLSSAFCFLSSVHERG